MTKIYVYGYTEYPCREDCVRGIIQDGNDKDVDDLFMEWLYDTYEGRLWDEFTESCIDAWTDDFIEEYFGVHIVNENARRPAAKRKSPAKRRTTSTRKPASKRKASKGARR